MGEPMEEGSAVSWSRTKKPKHKYHPHPDMTERIVKINKVWELSRLGMPQAEIGRQFDPPISQPTVSKLLREGLLLQAPPGAEEERILAIQQIEQLYKMTLEYIENGGDEVKLINTAVKLILSKAEFTGTKAAKKLEIGGRGMEKNLDPEIVEFITSLQDEDGEAGDNVSWLKDYVAAMEADDDGEEESE